MSHLIAVDIGGTQIRAARYLPDQILPEKQNRITTQGIDQTALERVMSAIASVWPEQGSVGAIAVAAPGPVDPFNGVIYAAPNIPGWVDLPLRHYLEERFQVPVVLGNDANMAALGEWQFGAGQGHHHVFYVTVSTGIGGGVIINDKLLLGHTGLATELGHVTIMQGGPLCGCGKYGHLEALASGTAIAGWVRSQLEEGAQSTLSLDQPISARLVAIAAREGDTLSIEAFHRAGFYLGQGIANYLHIFNPSIVIIGGGVSLSGRLLMDPLAASIRQHIITPHYLDDFTLTVAALGDGAGLLGALALARSLSPTSPLAEEIQVESPLISKPD